jgi:biotin carboxyl carrier protein
MAETALRERNLPLTEENIFLVASASVPGKNMELNEGIKFLTGKLKINLPLKKAPETKAIPPAPASVVAPLTGPVTTTCTVVEGAVTRTFRITIEPPHGADAAPGPNQPAAAPLATGHTTPVFSPFEGKVELVEINVKVGDHVKKGQVVASVEAMKAKHDVRSPADGHVTVIHASLGAEVTSGHPIMTIGT